MYKMGGPIRALDELARQEFIFFSSKNNPKLYHCGWFMSWQFRVAARYIRWGWNKSKLGGNSYGCFV